MGYFPSWGYVPAVPHVQPTPYWNVVPGDVVVFFGDSISTITYDYGGDWRDYCIAHHSTHHQTLPTFINSGLNGDTIANGKTVIASRVTAYSPTAVMMEFGTNDANAVTNPANIPTAVAAYTSDYNQAIASILSANPGVKIAIVGPCVWGDIKPDGSNTKDQQFDAFAAAASAIAVAARLPFIDQRAWYFSAQNHEASGTLFGDVPAVHPNGHGKQCLSSLLINALPPSP